MGMIIFFFILAIVINLLIARYAGKMGYSRMLWFITSFFLFNPLIALGLLAYLPDKSIEKIRNKEMKLLEKQLTHISSIDKQESSLVPLQTISDNKTIR